MKETLSAYCKRTGMDWLAKEWCEEKNQPLTLETVSYGSKRRVWWQCEKKHLWQAPIVDRMRGTRCPYCRGTRVQPGINDLATLYPELAGQWHPTENGDRTPDQFSSGSNEKVWWQCEKGHAWQAYIYARVAGDGCPYCSGKRVLPGENDFATLFPEIAAEWSERNAPLTPQEVRPYANRKVWWKCGNGHEWQATVNARVRDRKGCPYCSNRKLLTGFNDLQTRNPEIAAQWDRELNGDLTPKAVLFGSNRRVWWRCSQGHVWKAMIVSRTGKKRPGCPVCAGNISKKQRERYERIASGILPPTELRTDGAEAGSGNE